MVAGTRAEAEEVPCEGRGLYLAYLVDSEGGTCPEDPGHLRPRLTLLLVLISDRRPGGWPGRRGPRVHQCYCPQVTVTLTIELRQGWWRGLHVGIVQWTSTASTHPGPSSSPVAVVVVVLVVVAASEGRGGWLTKVWSLGWRLID